MNFRSIFLFLTFLLGIKIAAATTFTVTSNADAGPGTLREALTNANANGTATPDIIQFNLPGSLTTDRTIRLKSALPAITSNTIIDGTTQPGSPFGVSDAKVILEPETQPAYFNGFTIYYDNTNTNNKTQGIEIYGMYIRNFAKISSFNNYDGNQGSGIYFSGGGSGITIGAPGKGNVISGNINAVYSGYAYYNYISDVVIQSNIIGLADDGTTINSNINGINIQVDKSLTIGGDNANQGNVIAGNVANILLSNNFYYYINNAITISIKNNKIGTDYTGKIDYKQSPLFASAAFVTTYGIEVLTSYATVDIINNLVAGQRTYGIYIDNASFNIKGNKIGTDITGSLNLSNAEGIRAGQNTRGNIGGPNPEDVNYIGYNQYGIEAKNSSQTLITKNSIFCNSDYGISVPANYPFAEVLTLAPTAVTGLSTPNAAIELFYLDNCPNSCQGKQYLTTVQADGAGKWSYAGSMSGAIVATATDANKNTSAFSSLTLRANEVVVKHFTCAYKGSITIADDRQGILFHWDKKNDDGTITPVADAQSITDLQPGTYVLTMQYPGGCQKINQTFVIYDNRISIQSVLPPTPVCRQKRFPVDVYYKGGTGNVKFEWLDAVGNVVATGHPSTITGGGTFTLRISDDAGCSVNSDPFTIVPKPGPDFDYSQLDNHSAQCGKSDGYIKGIKGIDITGTASYQWYTYNDGKPIAGATSLDLLNIPGGTYYLTVTDQSECGQTPWQSQSFSVYTTNSVFIYYDTNTIVAPTCGLNNGSIGNTPGFPGFITVQNADKYDWYGPSNALIPNGNKLVLRNLSEGTYRLVATNTVTNCSNFQDFTVVRTYPDVFSPAVTYTPATCGLNNGGISLSIAQNLPQPKTYTWLDKNNVPISYTSSISNVPEGLYSVNVTDKNGCASTLGPYEIKRIDILSFDAASNPVPTNDQCDLQTGSIKGAQIKGGQAPYSFAWTDAGGKVVGTSLDLLNVGKGTYTLHIDDAIGCKPTINTGPITVDNDEVTLIPPVLNNVRICNPDVVDFVILNAQAGTYKLYKNIDDATPIVTSKTGDLALRVTETSDYYVSYNSGTCESARTKVHVEVILIDITMGNSFTPNGDGVNDYWVIHGLEKFPGSYVQVFTRAGYKVFESKNPNIFFDGKLNGKPLPVATYYYIINLNTPCTLLSGSLTLIR